MTTTKTITDTKQTIFSGATVGDVLILQNDSDTDFFYDIGEEDEELTTANGIRLEAGAMLTLEEPMSNKPIRMLHGGTGDKTLRVVSFS